jgi:hypothetical protein
MLGGVKSEKTPQRSFFADTSSFYYSIDSKGRFNQGIYSKTQKPHPFLYGDNPSWFLLPIPDRATYPPELSIRQLAIGTQSVNPQQGPHVTVRYFSLQISVFAYLIWHVENTS